MIYGKWVLDGYSRGQFHGYRAQGASGTKRRKPITVPRHVARPVDLLEQRYRRTELGTFR